MRMLLEIGTKEISTSLTAAVRFSKIMAVPLKKGLTPDLPLMTTVNCMDNWESQIRFFGSWLDKRKINVHIQKFLHWFSSYFCNKPQSVSLEFLHGRTMGTQ